ncbi:MarR family winged helix-turn-helix transcriptional regulator [Hydrogenophaga defluvii]|uniref:MarR family winged helix-turn-helix transcriptional regulator n=1 Tax=Hydrogenophaga defluvii TaxID=249410 RepID=A0ABW2S603_9BURK
MSTPQTPNDYRVTDQVGHLLRRAYQRHTAIFQSVVPANKLSAAQFVVLCAVRDHAGATIGDIVQATAMDEPAVRGIVERLKWTDLVSVAHEPGDKRHATVTLTALGQTTVDETLPHAQHISELTFGDLSADERQQLTALLRRISGTA